MRYILVTLITLPLVATGCERRSVETHAKPLGALIAERTPSADKLGKMPESKRRFREAAVYLDGVPKGVLKHSELASDFLPTMEKRPSNTEFPVYSLVQYLRSIGVELPKIRELHLYGGRRVCIIAGDEVRRQKDALKFSFSRGDSGKPRMEWPTHRIEMNSTIDIVQGIVIYQEKIPPRLDRSIGALTFDDGKPVEGIPYVPEEQIIKGTRLYVDGRLAGAVKRKQIPSTFQVAGSDAHPSFHLVPYLESLGTSLKRLKTIDFVAGEDTVARYDAASWKAVADGLVFSLPRRNQGQILVRFDRPDSPSVTSKVSAILVYDRTTPPDRTIHAPIPDEEGGGREPGAGPARSMLDERDND